MRTLSTTARRAMFAQETSEVFLILLTIIHPLLGAGLRFVNNTENILSRGSTYLGCPFEIGLPDDIESSPPKVTLRVDGIDQTVITAVRTITSQASLAIEVVLASDPDVVEAGPFNFTMKAVNYDATTVQAELAFEDFINEPFPSDSFDPTRFGGLFMIFIVILASWMRMILQGAFNGQMQGGAL